MDLETAQTTTSAKLPILKQGEYDMWRLRIEQYFQVQDYALWDVIENGNSFIPVAQTITNVDGTSTTLIPGPVITKEKVQKKNDVKARNMLLMALPNEHLVIFNQYKDAKTLFAAIQTRSDGNETTKKTQKTLLNQMYENFSASSIKSLVTIFNRLLKINNHVVVWRNKPDLDTMSFDDLYNNFKIVEQEVKGTANSSSSSRSQIPDNSRKGIGFVSYNVVSPPPTGLFSPSKLDLSNSGLEEFQQHEFEGYGLKTSNSVSEDISNEVKESPDTPLVKELVSDDKLEKKTVFLTVIKIEFVRPKQQEKPVKERVVSRNNYTRVNYNYSTRKAHPNAHRNIAPRAVLMKTGLRPLNTARPRAVNTARPNSVVVNVVRVNQVNAVKASTCWVWRPTKLNSASITLKKHNYIDTRGRSKLLLELQLPRVYLIYKKETSHIENADFAEIVDFLNANPTRQVKYLSGRVTPLFETMLIQHPAEVGEGSGQPTEHQYTPTTASPSYLEPIPTVPSSSQPKKTKKHRKTKRSHCDISV
nr:ribonuclease H-like domain-containing protein [Tanacetum cinerariifolium]